ncbi:MAG: Type-2 restriction enzyme RsrI [Firmicutes bacterium]|nr:Type-2 restriction enzyme RsrI [Bacillota bacterium]
MAKKQQLREQRAGTVINAISKKQESEVMQALQQVEKYLRSRFGETIRLSHTPQWYLKDLVSELKHCFPDVDFHNHFHNSSIRPDGGILFLNGGEDDKITYPILIAEVKNQGTNDLRLAEGKSKQARGNAIERLGKNVIGLRAALLRESIFPFVCFGYGCDFEEKSSILDRVTTIAMFGRLNTTYLFNENGERFNRGSFYFRENKWSVDEMFSVMSDIAERSVQYYFSKYREDHFRRP